MKLLLNFTIGLMLFNLTSCSEGLATENVHPEVVQFAAVVDDITWDKVLHEFGEIPQGEPVETEFVLQNNAAEPLSLLSVKTTCGCTVTEYEKEPILPGQSTIIKAKYNAKSPGVFKKPIKVMSNFSDEPIVLYIEGTVMKSK